ncbi:MAG: hypothetical protein ACRD0M_12095, partial [Acidimicrobiales bacterium]
AVDPATLVPPCPEDVANHGAYVSSVARTTFDIENAPPNLRGKVVSAAARSDCGRAASEEGDGEPEAEDEESQDEGATKPATEPERGKSAEAQANAEARAAAGMAKAEAAKEAGAARKAAKGQPADE